MRLLPGAPGLAILFFFVCAGCGGPSAPPDLGPPTQYDPHLDDLPVPQGFAFQGTNQSWIRAFPAHRVGYLVYQGPDRRKDASDFYVRTLPSLGWRHVRTEGDNPVSLLFVNATEFCKIILESKNNTVVICIDLRSNGGMSAD